MNKNILYLFAISLAMSSCTMSYTKLHKQAILVDTHNDFPHTAVEKKLAFDSQLKGQTHSDLGRMLEGSVDVQIFSIFCDGEEPQPFNAALMQIDSVYEWTRRNHRKMWIGKSPQE